MGGRLFTTKAPGHQGSALGGWFGRARSPPNIRDTKGAKERQVAGSRCRSRRLDQRVAELLEGQQELVVRPGPSEVGRLCGGCATDPLSHPGTRDRGVFAQVGKPAAAPDIVTSTKWPGRSGRFLLFANRYSGLAASGLGGRRAAIWAWRARSIASPRSRADS